MRCTIVSPFNPNTLVEINTETNEVWYLYKGQRESPSELPVSWWLLQVPAPLLDPELQMDEGL